MSRLLPGSEPSLTANGIRGSIKTSNVRDYSDEQQDNMYRGEQERMEPLLVPGLLDPVACLDETKAANREFIQFAGVLSIRDSPCRQLRSSDA